MRTGLERGAELLSYPFLRQETGYEKTLRNGNGT